MNKFMANPVTTFKKLLQPKAQQYHIKLYYLFISVFIFAFIYLVLPDENFSGVNLVKETIKTEIIKKKVKKNIDESFTEGFESLTQGYQFTSNSKLSPYHQAKVKQKLDEATDVVKDDVETDTITPDKIETSLSLGDYTLDSMSQLPPRDSPRVEPKVAAIKQNREIWAAGRATFYEWLNETLEDALEPELEIVDPHHHIWDMRELKGFNLFGMFKQQYYMAEELIDDFIGGGHNVTSTAFVTTHAFFTDGVEPAFMAPLGEVQAVQGVAAQFASGKYSKTLKVASCIIGTADLLQFGAEVEPLLVACKAASPNYRGIRCNAAHDPALAASKGNFHPTPGMYSDPKFREGFALLEKHELTFDCFIFSCQLVDEVHALAKAFPGTTIVLDHCGSPVAALGNYPGAPEYDGKQEEILQKWKEGLELIAKECPNVYCKVGGFAIPQVGSGLADREKPADSKEVAAIFKDMVMFAITTFGASRCMFEGNFPVDKVSVSYTVLWNAYKRITKDAGLCDEDRTWLFSGTAKKVYKM